jgi:hypothetical protein
VPSFPAITWHEGAYSANVQWYFVKWIAEIGVFVAGGKHSTGDDDGVLRTSADGISWTNITDAAVQAMVPTDAAFQRETGRLVIIGSTSFSGASAKCATSDDGGATWTARNVLTSEIHSGQTFDPISIVAVAGRLILLSSIAYQSSGQHAVAISDDGGVSWSGVAVGSGTKESSKMIANADASVLILIPVASGNPVSIPRSTDHGSTWTTSTGLPSESATQHAFSGAFLQGVGFIVAGCHGTPGSNIYVWSSPDALTWAQRYSVSPAWLSAARMTAVHAMPAPFVLSGQSQTLHGIGDPAFLASYDGSAWYSSTDPVIEIEQFWFDSAYSPELGRIVTVGELGATAYADLAPWFPAPSIGVFEGIQRFRLMIEGWPDEYVTDPWITHANNADGRTVNNGLLYQGLRIDERIIMQEAKVEAPGMTFKVRPADHTERTLKSFTTYPRPVASLGTSVDAIATSFAWGSGFAPANGEVYHLGTEAVRYHSSGGNVSRHVWDTVPQAHSTFTRDRSTVVRIYEIPPAMEGRRCYLYAYGEYSDPAGDGFLIWTGVVATPPALDRDGMTWGIHCMSIVQVLQQSVAGALQEAHPIGIYNHGECSFGYLVTTGSGAPRTLTGFYESEAAFILAANAALETARSDTGLSAVDANSLRIEKGSATGWRLTFRTNATISPATMIIAAACPSMGATVDAVNGKWTRDDGKTYGVGDTLAANRTYYADLIYDDPFYYGIRGLIGEWHYPMAPLGMARNVFRQEGTNPDGLFVAGSGFNAQLVVEHDATIHADNPAWRIYVDADMSGAQAVLISNSFNTDAFTVTATGDDGFGHFYIEVAPWVLANAPLDTPPAQVSAGRQGFAGFLGADTKIVAVRSYVADGNVADFAAALAAASVDANDGDTPCITSRDLALPWALGPIAGLWAQQHRAYRFTRALQVGTILEEDLKFANHFMRLEIDGRIGILPLPDATELAFIPDTHRITEASYFAPAGGYGAWPGWAPQRDGLITAVEIATGYNARDDSFGGEPLQYQDPDSVAKHKTRGKVGASIAPKSAMVAPIADRLMLSMMASCASNYLNAFARDYCVVTLEVSIAHFTVLCGDVVEVTSRQIPNGTGTRGVVSRRGVVIGRKWNLDAAHESMGELDIRIESTTPALYAPSAAITGHANTSGNTWAIACAKSNLLNRLLASRVDGKVLEHFAVGDFVRVFVVGSANTSTDVLGQIGAVNADDGTVTVTFTSTWTPSTSEWMLEFQKDDLSGTKSTAAQRAFCYVADGDLLLPTGAFVEDLS